MNLAEVEVIMQIELAIVLNQIDAVFKREILLHVTDGRNYTS